MTRVSRSNSAIYDDQDENYLSRNHGNVAPHQRLDKHAHDMGVYPEDENDDFLDKENQPAGMVTYEDQHGAPMRKRTRKSMEAEELQHQQHPDAQGDADRLAQDQARRQRARQAQLQSAGHPSQQAQPRDEEQRKKAKGQQQSSQQQQQGQAMSQREIAFKEKYDKLTQAIEYGDVYCDSKYEYRNVTLPKIMLSFIDRRFMEHPDNPYSNVLRILTEEEWREVGITMSQYWVNWMRHDPEPHVLLFRRPVGTGAKMKKESERVAREAQEEKRRLEQEAQNGLGPSEQQPQLQQQQQQQQQLQQLQQQQHYHHQQQQQH
ncbi:Cyclin-dependent kinases regulatory subunit (Cell division control protein cks1) [Mortierella alpina]|nr:Cyclin-dependent kinases regulatory subunit (Cell division control protein cks1) [Mortierella alpina]